MVKQVNDEPVTCHVFEYTTSDAVAPSAKIESDSPVGFALDGNLHFKYPDKGVVPCQIIFCMKEKNVRRNLNQPARA